MTILGRGRPNRKYPPLQTVVRSGGGGGGPASVATLVDGFASANAAVWTFGSSTAVSGGQLSVTPTTSLTNSSIITVATYDFTSSSVAAKLVQNANLGSGTIQTLLGASTDAAYTAGALMIVNAGSLVFVSRLSGAGTTVGSVTYDPVAHANLRIRSSGTTIFFDTSADASTWTNQASFTETFGVTALLVSLGSYFTGTEPTPGTAIWDNVNIPTVPLAETGAGTDTLSVSTGNTKNLTETGTGTDALTVKATVVLAETGTGATALTAAPVVAWVGTNPWIGSDPWPGPDSASNALPDTGTFTDAVTVKATVPLAETGTSTGTLTVPISVTVAETGHGTDTMSAIVQVAVTDSGSGTDAVSVKAVVPVTESGTGTDGLVGTSAVLIEHVANQAVLLTDGVNLATLAAQTVWVTTIAAQNPGLATLATSGTSTATLTASASSATVATT